MLCGEGFVVTREGGVKKGRFRRTDDADDGWREGEFRRKSREGSRTQVESEH